MFSSIVNVTVQFTPTCTSTCFFCVYDETERFCDTDPSFEKLRSASKTAIVAIKPTDPSNLLIKPGDIAGDIMASLVQQAKQWETDQVTHH
jgi:hypothetical protein